MDSSITHSTTPQKSSLVARKYTRVSEKTMLAKSPRKKVGTARARLGPMRVLISRPMSRPPSDEPKSMTSSGTERR
ncbi:hypothetical protein D3C87_1635990 [compost metagenome]